MARPKEKTDRISINPTLDDYAVIERIAAAQRRTPADVMRLMFEDLLAGRVNIDDVLSANVKRKPAGVCVPAGFKAEFDALRGSVSADKVLHALVVAAASVEQGGSRVQYVSSKTPHEKEQNQ